MNFARLAWNGQYRCFFSCVKGLVYMRGLGKVNELPCTAWMVQCQCLTNCTPTPLLIQQQWTNNKFGFVLDYWRGRCAVSQILTLIGMDLVHVDSSDRKFPQTRNVKLVCYWLKKKFSRRGTLTFLSLEAVAKYLSSSLQAHDQIILACWFLLSLRATRLKSWPVASTKKWNKQISDHSLLIVGGGGGGENLEDFGGGGIIWFSGRTEGGSVVTDKGGGWGPEKFDW